MDRSAIDQFLADTVFARAERTPIAGDASNRRYLRLVTAGASAILQVSEPGQLAAATIHRTIALTDWLCTRGLAVPAILKAAPNLGFLLIEDFGDALFSTLFDREPGRMPALAATASEALLALARHDPPDFVEDIVPQYRSLAATAWEWYAPATGNPTSTGSEALDLLDELFATLPFGRKVLIHRDFHAGNLLLLPSRAAPQQAGLIDFQDAMAGHLGYDLVSLTRDARRDIPDAIHQHAVAAFANRLGLDPRDFARQCAVLGVQRNLRILGIFARLCLRDGKAHYVDFIPTVYRHLMRDLANQALVGLAKVITNDLPAPSPELLMSLKARCGTLPTV